MDNSNVTTPPPTMGDRLYWFSLFTDSINQLSELLDSIHAERIRARVEAAEDREALMMLCCAILSRLDQERTTEAILAEVDAYRKAGKHRGKARVS